MISNIVNQTQEYPLFSRLLPFSLPLSFRYLIPSRISGCVYLLLFSVSISQTPPTGVGFEMHFLIVVTFFYIVVVEFQNRKRILA